jgi:Putative zinc-finger
MSNETMSHDQAVSSQAAERYLLGELTPGEREAFEGHYFDCSACFEQIEMGSQFLGRAREILNPEPEKGWFAKLFGDLSRPAPAFVSAMLLCAVGIGAYQQAELANAKAPRVEARYVLAPARGDRSAEKVMEVSRKSDLSLALEFTPEPQFTSYTAQIVSEAKKVVLEFPVPPQTFDSSLAVAFPANKLEAGKYSVVIRGVTTNGAVEKVGESPFELQFTN